jgi:hypothetical protein
VSGGGSSTQEVIDSFPENQPDDSQQLFDGKGTHPDFKAATATAAGAAAPAAETSGGQKVAERQCDRIQTYRNPHFLDKGM